jgi:hypothetical protein
MTDGYPTGGSFGVQKLLEAEIDAKKLVDNAYKER